MPTSRKSVVARGPAPKVVQPTTVAAPARLACPSLRIPDVDGLVERVDEFLDRVKPHAVALAVDTLADIAQDTDPENHRINATRVTAAMGLAKIGGALVDRVEVQQHTTLMMRDKSDAELEAFMNAKQADVLGAK